MGVQLDGKLVLYNEARCLHIRNPGVARGGFCSAIWDRMDTQQTVARTPKYVIDIS